jgi:hypothetical protein
MNMIRLKSSSGSSSRKKVKTKGRYSLSKRRVKKIKRPPRDFIKHAQEDQNKHPILKDNFGP